MEMFLELALGNEKKHYKVNGFVVQGIKIDAFGGAAEGANHFINQIGARVGNPYTKPDAGAHGVFAFAHDGGDGLAMFRLDLSRRYEVLDQFFDRFPAVRSPEFRGDLFWA